MTPFFILAAVTLAGACGAMLFRGLVHSALALALAFTGIGCLYLSLGAEFLGLAQLLVYVGAIAVLIVFVVLLTGGGDSESSPLRRAALPLSGLGAAAAVFAVLAWCVLHSGMPALAGQSVPQTSVQQLGSVLMSRYVLPLEIIGLMLTASLIGSVVVAMKEKPSRR